MNLVCNICQKETRNITAHIQHSRLHSTVPNCTFICPIDGCITSCRKFVTFRLHLYRVHAQKRKQYRGNIASQNCKCPFTFCEYQCSNRHDFVQHLKVHLNDGHVVTCPFSNCTGVFRVASSFTSHLSRKHKVADEQSLKPEYQEASASAANEAVRPVPSAGSSVDVSDHESELPANLDSSDDNDTDRPQTQKKAFCDIFHYS